MALVGLHKALLSPGASYKHCQTLSYTYMSQMNSLAPQSDAEEFEDKSYSSDTEDEASEEEIEEEFPQAWNEETMREFSVTETDLNLCCFDGGGGSQDPSKRTSHQYKWWRGPFCFLCIPFSLPVYVSPAFLNALSWALRTAVAAVASTAICIWTPLPHQFAAATFLAPIGAIFGSTINLGRSLNISWVLVCGSFIGAMISLGIVAEVATEGLRFLDLHRLYFGLALIVSTFVISWPNYHPVAQKLALVYNAVVILFFAKDPSIDIISPFCYVALITVGAVCAVLTMILPWPATSQRELAECIGVSLHTAAKLCQCIIWYYNTPPERDIRRLHLKEKTQLLFSVLKDNLAIAKLRLAETSWERFLLCNKGYETYIIGLEAMARSLEGMHQSSLLAVDGEAHKHFLTFLKPSFSAVNSSMMIYLDELAHSLNKQHVGVLNFRRSHRRRRHLKLKMQQQGNEQRSYHYSADIQAAMERVIQDYTESRRKAFYEEESNERIEVEDLDLSQLLPLASFISNMKNLINLASDLKQVKLEWHWSWQFILSIYPLHFLVDAMSFIVGLPQNCTTVKEHLQDKGVLHLIKLLLTKAYNLLTLPQTIGAVQMTLALSVASLMVLIPAIDSWFDYGVWAPLTVALVMDKKQGLSFRQSMLRLQGTVLGSLVGYLALIISDNKPVGILLFLFGWVLLCGYARSDKTVEYPGTVAAFTAGIVMLVGEQPTTENVEKLALGRIEANFLGILVIFGISFLWPRRSANALRHKLIPSTIKQIRELAGVVFESFLTSPQLSPSGTSTEPKEDLKVKAAGLTKAIAGHLQLQLVLIDAATQEPQLWRSAFAVEVHRAIFALESKLLRDLMMIQQVIASAKKEGKEIYSLLVPALMQPLQRVEGEVLGCLGELLNRMRTPPPKPSASEEADRMEKGERVERSFSPLKMHITLETCKQDLRHVLDMVVRDHLRQRRSSTEPVLSSMDTVSQLAFLFAVRQFMGGVASLWPSVLLLLHTEKLYSRPLQTDSALLHQLHKLLSEV